MVLRKRAVVCRQDPWLYIDDLRDYSIMIINPASPLARRKYLLDRSDYSLLLDDHGEHVKDGGAWPDEKVFWYTSGTTGDSKFCSFTDQQVDDLAQRLITTYEITANDRYTSIMPLWHAHGQGFFWATKKAGCEHHFLNLKDIDQLQTLEPTFITAIPDLLKLVSNMSLNGLRFIRSASAAMPGDLYLRLEKIFGVPVIEAFGMTEALSHCFTNPLHGIRKIGTIGRPDGVEAKIQNQRLFIKGPTVCAPDWYDTGDLATVDRDGYYTIIGRSKDQINIRGIKVNPVSVESQLRAGVPDLLDCVIFGQDRLMCVYTGSAAEDLVKQFLLSLGQHMNPKLLRRVDTIPDGPSGKRSRLWLLDHYSNG